MRVMLDVGAHYGETLDVALDPRWGFDKVYSFEPATACQGILRRFRDTRLAVLQFGLSNKSTTASLYGAGLLGASVYADKPQYDEVVPEIVMFVRAADWLAANTAEDDDVFLKLNCEGSECDILEDLLKSPFLERVRSIYVDFDASKIPSQAHRVVMVRDELLRQGIDHHTPQQLGVVGNAAVYEWLRRSCPPVTVALRSAIAFRLRLHRPPYLWAKAIAQAVLPTQALWWIGRRVRRLRR